MTDDDRSPPARSEARTGETLGGGNPFDGVIETDRLLLRAWRDSDLAPFAAMGRDPDVMRFFPALVSRQTSDEMVGRVRAHFEREGWGLWAVEIKGGAPFVGFCGIQRVPFDAAFTPAVEVGWRFARDAWGHGYATEGARASLAYAFATLHLSEVVAMVVPDNARSIAVMHRLGMTRDVAADFDHPRFSEELVGVGGFPVRRHQLFRIRP